MARTFPVCLLLAALAGCLSTQPEQTAFEYKPGGPARTEPVPQTSVYALYRVADPAGQPAHVLCAQVPLHKGSRIGFDDSQDKPRAVAGSESLPLTAGRYRWETMTPHGPPQAKLGEVGGWSINWESGYSEQARLALEKSGQVLAFPFMVAGYAVVMAFGAVFGLPFGA